MDKSRKLYLKALNLYEKGYIDNAIDVCEESISINMKNTASINLKGLLYYFKGDIEGAKSLWKLNSQLNGDEVFKKYLHSVKDDEQRLLEYTKAIKFMQKSKIQEALQLLLQCKESDYNCINVNNAIATCYIKLRDYNKAVVYIKDVLKLDRKNQVAIKSKKIVVKNGIKNKEFHLNGANFLLTKVIIGCILIALVCSTGGIFYKKYYRKPATESVKRNKVAEKNIDKCKAKEKANNKNISTNKNSNTKNDVNKDLKKEAFPKADFEKGLNEKDYYKLYDYVTVWKNKNININDKMLFSKGEETLKKEGIKCFYNKGKEYLFSQNNYKNAINEFKKAYDLDKENYLYQDVVYMIGVSYHNLGDVESAIRYFEEYDKNFRNGSYEDEVLYRLVNINKSLNNKKFEVYAERLVDNYPNSQYNNSLIKSLAN